MSENTHAGTVPAHLHADAQKCDTISGVLAESAAFPPRTARVGEDLRDRIAGRRRLFTPLRIREGLD